MAARKKGLGKGADILFGDTGEKTLSYFECDIEKIIPNKYQPRTTFKESELEELSESIRENGIIQPLIVVRKEDSSDERYELIAGERRLRASKLAGLQKVPVVIKELEKEEALLELAIIENVQRTDLNPIEEAEAYKKLIDDFNYTQEQAALKVGKKRTTISNLIRLLKLPSFIQEDVGNNMLSEGHARCLLRLEGETATIKEVRDQIISNGLSVRQTEKLVRKIFASQTANNTAKRETSPEISSAYVQSYINQLENRLGSRVKVNQNGSRGTVEIEYYSRDDLERVVGLIIE